MRLTEEVGAVVMVAVWQDGTRVVSKDGRQALARLSIIDGNSGQSNPAMYQLADTVAQLHGISTASDLDTPSACCWCDGITSGLVFMDDYVLPSEPVMDYLTRFSGKNTRIPETHSLSLPPSLHCPQLIRLNPQTTPRSTPPADPLPPPCCYPVLRPDASGPGPVHLPPPPGLGKDRLPQAAVRTTQPHIPYTHEPPSVHMLSTLPPPD